MRNLSGAGKMRTVSMVYLPDPVVHIHRSNKAFLVNLKEEIAKEKNDRLGTGCGDVDTLPIERSGP